VTTSTIQQNGNGSLSGFSVAHRKLSPRERLALAADVASGVSQFAPTKAQIASSFKVHPSQLSRELREREGREAAQRYQDNRAVECIVSGWNSASESALDEAVLKIGLARVYDVIERLTK
jgi:IS30 family transposase